MMTTETVTRTTARAARALSAPTSSWTSDPHPVSPRRARRATRTLSQLRSLARRRIGARTVRRVLRAEPASLAPYDSFTVLSAHNDLVVALVRRSGSRDCVLKVARRSAAGRSLAAHAAGSAALRDDPRLDGFVSLVPVVEWTGTVEDHPCLVEVAMPGVTSDQLVANRAEMARALLAAVTELGPLHERTSRRRIIDDDLLRRWVHEPLRSIADASGDVETAARAAALSTSLSDALSGREVTVCRIHGDYTLGNLMYAPSTGALAAVLDWEASAEPGLPEVDLLHLLISARLVTDGVELDEVIDDLVGFHWRRGEIALIAYAAASRPNENLSSRSLVILAWLAHVSSNLAKARRYGSGGRWFRRNVAGVLARLVPDVDTPAAFDSTDIAASIGTPMSPPAESSPTRLRVPLAVVLLVVVQLWVWGVRNVDLSRMSDTGLVSLLRPPAFAALGLLTVSFMATLFGRRPTSARLSAHIVLLIGLIHATPPLLYGTLRYSWAWKHLAIVEYISRSGRVDPRIATLPAYHNWPGFFSFAALVTKLAGASDAIAIATWSPVVFNLLTFCALLFLYRTLTREGRIAWLACWLYFVSNWVGQDYFSPQALAFVIYLVVLAVVIDRHVGRRRSTPNPAQARAISYVIALCTLAIVSSHQLTPMMLVVALTALTVTRLAKVGRFALFALVANLVWYATAARPFVAAQIEPSLRAVGAILGNTEGSLHDTATSSHGQVIVSLLGRMTVAVVSLLAVVGFARRWRHGKRDLVPATLAIAPATFLAVNDYGGEIVFRVFLFACPFLAYLAAHALVPRRPARRRARVLVAPVAASLVLLGGFLFGYYGKDRQYHFTTNEVAATTYLLDNASSRTLLVSATSNYPNIFRGYERFVPVVVNLEDAESRARVVADPAGVLSSWLDDPRYSSAYVLLTRSQAAEVDSLGPLPAGSVGVIERALAASPRFQLVFSTADAMVFTLAGGGGRS